MVAAKNHFNYKLKQHIKKLQTATKKINNIWLIVRNVKKKNRWT